MENQFIKKLNNTANLDAIKECVEHILLLRPWPNGSIEDCSIVNQIGLTHRQLATNEWLDASGGGKDNQAGKLETEFNVWNKHLPINLIDSITGFAKEHNFTPGRVRLMRLMPKTGLMMHQDTEQRYHLAITTNIGCFVCTPTTVNPSEDYQIRGYHIPADGHFYKVDTTVHHFVYNSGNTERVHLVINAIPNN
jgi:hypothetical protein